MTTFPDGTKVRVRLTNSLFTDAVGIVVGVAQDRRQVMILSMDMTKSIAQEVMEEPILRRLFWFNLRHLEEIQ